MNPADDAGGMAVAYKLDSDTKTYGSSKAEYPKWYLLSSGSGWVLFKITGNILSRMSELAPWQQILLKIHRISKTTPRSLLSYKASSVKSKTKNSTA